MAYKNWTSDDRVTEFLRWQTHSDLSVTEGVTREALQAIIAFFFNEVGINRIEAQHDPNNPHSGDVMKKCGMKYEGTLRQADYINKGIVDAAMYSLLRSEWSE